MTTFDHAPLLRSIPLGALVVVVVCRLLQRPDQRPVRMLVEEVGVCGCLTAGLTIDQHEVALLLFVCAVALHACWLWDQYDHIFPGGRR